MPDVVSCTKTPYDYYVCFSADYHTFVSNKFIRGTTRPPGPPSNMCRLPDLLRIYDTPDEFAADVGVPCRITVPCVIVKYVDGREVVLEEVNDDMCVECLEAYPPLENTYCSTTWEYINTIMNTVKHRTAFGHKVYRSAVFIGKRKAYVAPWSPTRLIYDTYLALRRMGLVDSKLESEIVKKYNALEIYDILAYERFGSITAVGFNLHEHEDRCDALAMFWVENDAAARRYALRIWDLHVNFATKIIEILEDMPDTLRLAVENNRNLHVVGRANPTTFFSPVKGYSVEDLGKAIEFALIKDPTIGKPIRDPSGTLSLLMDTVIGASDLREAINSIRGFGNGSKGKKKE